MDGWTRVAAVAAFHFLSLCSFLKSPSSADQTPASPGTRKTGLACIFILESTKNTNFLSLFWFFLLALVFSNVLFLLRFVEDDGKLSSLGPSVSSFAEFSFHGAVLSCFLPSRRLGMGLVFFGSRRMMVKFRVFVRQSFHL